jgi:hypothetical protein
LLPDAVLADEVTKFVPGRIDKDTVYALRTSLGEVQFELAHREGERMPQNRMIEYAIGPAENDTPAV